MDTETTTTKHWSDIQVLAGTFFLILAGGMLIKLWTNNTALPAEVSGNPIYDADDAEANDDDTFRRSK